MARVGKAKFGGQREPEGPPRCGSACLFVAQHDIDLRCGLDLGAVNLPSFVGMTRIRLILICIMTVLKVIPAISHMSGASLSPLSRHLALDNLPRKKHERSSAVGHLPVPLLARAYAQSFWKP